MVSVFDIDLDVVQCINIHRLRWLGRVVRMEEDALARRVFDAGIAEVGEEVDLVSVGRIKSRSPVIDWSKQLA